MTRARTRTPARVSVPQLVALLPSIASAVVIWSGNRLVQQIDSLDARLRVSELQIAELRAQRAPADSGYRWGVLPLIEDAPPVAPKRANAPAGKGQASGRQLVPSNCAPGGSTRGSQCAVSL